MIKCQKGNSLHLCARARAHTHTYAHMHILCVKYTNKKLN